MLYGQDNRSSTGARQVFPVTRVCQKTDLAITRRLQCRNRRYRTLRIALQLTSDAFCQLPQYKTHPGINLASHPPPRCQSGTVSFGQFFQDSVRNIDFVT